MIFRLLAALNWTKIFTQMVIAALTTVVTLLTKKLMFAQMSPPPA